MFTALRRSDSAVGTKWNVVALILRAGLAAIFLYHGLDKITKGDGGTAWVDLMYAGQSEYSETKPKEQRYRAVHLPAGVTFSGTQLAVAWGEFLGGLALAVGLLTRVAALGLIIIQVGAICVVTAPRGFHFEKGGGYEYNLALLAMCLALLIMGAGAWSVDHMLARRRTKSRGQTTATAPSSDASPLAPAQPMEPIAPVNN
jgi:putative oxidoreductase